jgi:hypothetical protein
LEYITVTTIFSPGLAVGFEKEKVMALMAWCGKFQPSGSAS